ncbi:3D-(3,5/4)-trihydroxycyclohexane-1,2-dione acylhydrolase (decyclizing) [Azospirillum lipoferum]|uniref:3D-(3,5/4)-trihydroxycyclohexane-1,2-dione acylhydrolase (Decyclizing) n=1 Tax=Azospirillum lipoferum TaxID=193 RepID=A0A5A9G6X5_AZOLI|nr:MULTISPECIES: 3D-(3,5/4)-trihydroxycyclohexane-1,2-dione acylhydrolase (decyclizing) [Azospirillum]KAA0590313.1 3D-(3,5/4)-trihydroxycyclohexane-1,2-dione acylhydrolase (decyclizing) [Azospirillum lipoferum]MCP1614930.1 3D-(3,5/4)-trihydroxycyclohexane-1,2-dione acylhydrolase (decyclizing) [Azospirillum lipoferum]MDW5532524.1 3D-(3,5/4)-trihydroxycyclohexane-1,2-dione acylhydrolase (decyclizing) [Azospirillum sp. NL1]
MDSVRLTVAQAVVRYLSAQYVEIDGRELPLFAGVWAIFGHGNVAGIGEALHAARDVLPTYRAHNEQGMTHAAIAYAKAQARRRMMACTTSIGPGAVNMVTAAALAHVNRLPVLLLPGDVFATRAPDPVLQQVERFEDATVSANDCFRPVSRFWDRITRPEQLMPSLRRAIQVLTDPVDCGPVTLCLPQDVQAEAYDFPVSFFERTVRRTRRPEPDRDELAAVMEALRTAQKPLIVAGGGVFYSGACDALADFAKRRGIPVAETQAGKGALVWDHPCNVGAIGVTGSSAANELAAEADLVLAVGTRLADFTTASWTIFANCGTRLAGLNVAAFDAVKGDALPLVADAARGLAALDAGLGDWAAPLSWQAWAQERTAVWTRVVERVTADAGLDLPTDAQVLGAVNRAAGTDGIVVCAAGGLPGELHKLWRSGRPGGYHLEYGFSCMGYEIAGGLGVKMACPDRETFIMVGDGSYMMLNSELAVSVMMKRKLVVVLLDNRGYGCINRLQNACGGASFNNLLRDTRYETETLPDIDFAGHLRSLGAVTEKVKGVAELEQALERAKESPVTYAIVIDTDPLPSTREGGAWWDVPVPEVSTRPEVAAARESYDAHKARQRR